VGLAKIRRSGDVVEFYSEFISGAVAATSPFVLYTLPVGFRPAFVTYAALLPYAATTPTAIYSAGSGALNIYSTPLNNGGMRHHGTWITNDAWPTTLP
jgi:hypothetical protein